VIFLKIQITDEAYVQTKIPSRDPETHKGNYGRILLLCGSRGFSGAAALAANSALRTGAGVVYLAVPESIYVIEAVKVTEAVVLPFKDQNGMFSEGACEQILSLLPKMDAVLIGPGIGRSFGSFSVVRYVLQNATCPVVLDADGINVLEGHTDILRERTAPTILTPHAGEFLTAFGFLPDDRIMSAAKMAKEYGCVMLLKGHKTLITDGQVCFENHTGNAGMAKGGSGDVLAGMITALLGQKLSPMDAAICGAWIHGRAGDICRDEIGMYGMLPSDMICVLPRLLP